MSPVTRAVVVVPARDEEQRIGACLAALAAQEGVAACRWSVVLVLDGCRDATAAIARATAARTGLALETVDGPGLGVGHARRLGMAVAAEALRGPGRRDAVIASTDADSVVAPDWLARILAAVELGAEAVGGRIALDAVEAAALPPVVLTLRAQEARRRLAAVRCHTPGAEHHQFSGASLALTLEAHDAIGGLPAVPALEDEGLERALRAAGLPIAYVADVRATTSARTEGHVPRGLAQVLRTATWQAAARTASSRGAQARPVGADAATTTVRATGGARGDDVHAALPGARDIVLVVGPGVARSDAAALAAALHADPALQLVRAAEPAADPLAELVVRPSLNLLAAELAVVASPLTRTWAARRSLLDALALPHGDAVDLTVLVDTWIRHGLGAIAELDVPAPPPGSRDDPPLSAYELLAALATRLPASPALSSAFSDPAGTRRARLDEHAPADHPGRTRLAPAGP